MGPRVCCNSPVNNSDHSAPCLGWPSYQAVVVLSPVQHMFLADLTVRWLELEKLCNRNLPASETK